MEENKIPASVEKKELRGVCGCAEYFISLPSVCTAPAISAFHKRRAEKYLENLARRALHRNISWNVWADFQESFNEYPILSIFTDTYEDLGPMGSRILRSAFTWDTKNQRLLSIADIFENPGLFSSAVRTRALEYIKTQQLSSPGSVFFDAVKRLDGWGWYLCDLGAAIFWQRGKIAPESCGLPSLIIPFKDLALKGPLAQALK